MSPTSGLVAPPEAIPTSPRGGAEVGVARCNGRRIRGKCKWFDVAKGFGFITPITPQPATGTRSDDSLGTSLLGKENSVRVGWAGIGYKSIKVKSIIPNVEEKRFIGRHLHMD